MKHVIRPTQMATIKLLGIFFVLTLAGLPNLNAGDAYFLEVNFRSVFYAEDEKSVDITFGNDEAFDVTDFSVGIQIRYQLSPSEWNVVYEWSQEGLTVEANSTLDVSTDPETWSPDMTGKYQLSVETYSPVDINLSNNSLTKDFLVGDYQRIAFKQFNMINPFQQENSTLGAVGFKLPPNEETRFINVMAQKKESTETEWLVRNLPVLPFSDTRYLYYHFDYSWLNYTAGETVESVDIAVQEDAFELSAGFEFTGLVNFNVWNMDYDIPGDNEETDIEVPSILDELEDLPFPLFGDVYSIDYEYIGCEMPNIELDSNKNGITEDYAGDWNACGPAAAANSLQWLENTVEEIPDTETSHRDKLKELSGLMERGDGEGVTTEQLVKGKLAFIDKYKLPIHVKYQSWWNQDDSIPSPDTTYGHFAENKADTPSVKKAPTWEFLKEEVKKGEDVEILFGWYDHGAERHGGHWVAVSGVSETNYARGVYIKEDWDQSDSVRTTHEKYLRWVANEEETWGRLEGYDGPNNNAWVESVVSESYDSTITFGDEEPEPEPEAIFGRSGLITSFNLLNNRAPVGEQVQVQFTLAESSVLTIEVFSMKGLRVAELNFSQLPAGTHTKLIPGSYFPEAGNYFIRVSLGSERHMMKMVRY